MIRRPWGRDKWMLITQVEHARLAGVMAAAWRYAPVRPHGEVLRAIAQHDDGWLEVDATPQVNGRGEPRSFMEMPRGDHYAIWSRSIALLAERGWLYGACVVAQYFMNRARHETDMARLSPREAVALGNFLAEQQHRLERWRAELQRRAAESTATSLNPNDTAASGLVAVPVGGSFDEDVRLLDICDRLSILLLTDFAGTTTLDHVPYLEGTDKLLVRRPQGKFGLEIHPCPFRKHLRDHVRAVIIPAKPYTSDQDLLEAVHASAPVSQEFLLSGSSEVAMAS